MGAGYGLRHAPSRGAIGLTSDTRRLFFSIVKERILIVCYYKP